MNLIEFAIYGNVKLDDKNYDNQRSQLNFDIF